MKTIYIDENFKCHVADDGTMRAVETDAFYGKCDAFIEGYRMIPAGEGWTRADVEVFPGFCITPWKNPDDLYDVQRADEEETKKDMENALKILLGGDGA